MCVSRLTSKTVPSSERSDEGSRWPSTQVRNGSTLMWSGQPLMQNLAGELLRVKDAYEREELVTVPRTTLSRIETDQAFLCSQVYSIIGRNYIYELDAWTGAVEGLSLWSRDRGLTLRAQQSSKTSRTYCPRAESRLRTHIVCRRVACEVDPQDLGQEGLGCYFPTRYRRSAWRRAISLCPLRNRRLQSRQCELPDSTLQAILAHPHSRSAVDALLQPRVCWF